MSLNNNQMLPLKIRNMRQMNDVLNAEDIILSEIERIIDEMYQRASLLHEELVNEEWLEKHLEVMVEGVVEVKKIENELQIEILINKGELSNIHFHSITKFLEKWLPAHLAYNIVWQKILSVIIYHGFVWQNDEEITIRQVIV